MMWAPLMWPNACTSVPMARPKASEICRMLGRADGHFRAEPRPMKTKMSVEMNSTKTDRAKAKVNISLFIVGVGRGRPARKEV